ncbi:hypothetical protein AVEN_219853-1, partial [Araneus ventricosus]
MIVLGSQSSVLIDFNSAQLNGFPARTADERLWSSSAVRARKS